MRSEAIFLAEKKVLNRYQLCQTLARVTRRLHINFNAPKDTITTAFANVAASSLIPAQPLVAPIA